LVLALLGAAGLGVLLGLSLRVTAVLAASAVIALSGAVITPFVDAGVVTAALTTLGSIVALQFGYVGGLALSCAWSRVKSPFFRARGSTLNIARWAEGRHSSQAS
jgi:hypothetical protein